MTHIAIKVQYANVTPRLLVIHAVEAKYELGLQTPCARNIGCFNNFLAIGEQKFAYGTPDIANKKQIVRTKTR